MKLRHLFLAAIVALGMVACNNEDVPAVVDGADGTVSVKVMPVSNGATARLSGDLNGTGLTAESAVKKTQVWVFMGNVLDGYGESVATTADEVKDIPVHVGARDIYIVVNGGALGLQKLTSKADIEAAVTTVPVNIDDNGLVMTAEKITATLVAGKNTIGYGATVAGTSTSLGDTPVKVARVNARVAIVSAELALDDQNQKDIFDNLQNVQVAMFNVNEKAKVFNPNASVVGNWLYGSQWPALAATYEQDPTTSAASAAFFEGATTAFSMPIGITNAPYFYVNPLETVNKMFIVLRGKAFKGTTAVIAEGLYTDAAGYTYFPVWVNGKDLGYAYTGDNTNTGKVLRNTQYNISLTIKKIGNPTIDPVEEAFLDVKVEVLPWEVVKQDVTWE